MFVKEDRKVVCVQFAAVVGGYRVSIFIGQKILDVTLTPRQKDIKKKLFERMFHDIYLSERNILLKNQDWKFQMYGTWNKKIQFSWYGKKK